LNTVEPIRDYEKIREIKEYLRENERPRNYLLFVFGINSALRISDLLSLKVEDMRKPSGEIRESIYLRESKTNKEKNYTLSNAAKDALRYYFELVEAGQSDWLFPSSKGGHIGRSWAWELINRWTSEVGLEGRYGCHSLRKSWGYHARVTEGAPIELIQAKLNHSNPAVTRRYIGIEQEEIAELERNVSL